MKKSTFFIAYFIFLFNVVTHAQVDPYCTVGAKSYQQINLHFSSGDLLYTHVKTEEGMHTQITMDGFYPSSSVGNPDLPVLSRTIEIPLCTNIKIKIRNQEETTYKAKELGILYPIFPVQPPRSKSDGSPHVFAKNDTTYAKNDFYGNAPIQVEKIGIARNVNLATLYFSPIRYNPVTGEIKVIKNLDVEITFEDADIAATNGMKKNHYSPAFSIKSDIVNLDTKEMYTSAPLRYLIVSHASFRGQLDTFIDWKKRKGFLVDIAYTDDVNVGTSTTSIQSYIKSQYTNATVSNPAPTYVLLVGDIDQIPAFDSRVSSSFLNDHITDLYYFTWTDGDNIPDCYYGRFSAQTITQLTPQIEKTLMYEQYMMSDPSYLDNALLVAGVDRGNSSDYGYTHANPSVRYIENTYVNASNGFHSVTSYYNPTSNTGVAATGVVNTLNAGVGLANYSAHCDADGWSTPSFSRSSVSLMNNTQKFGLMIGNCCLSNKFDESECFGEALLRKSNYCGAVGYIGGSNSTYWDQDYWWSVGVRSINTTNITVPTYNANNLGVYDRLFHTHNENYSDWYTSNGAIIMAGNMAVETSTTSSLYKLYYWEIYHLMGDPSVMSWLTQAPVMNVSTSDALFIGLTSLAVQAVPYAYVALTDTNRNLIAAAFADALGNVSLTFDAMEQEGTYELVVSAQNYQTYFKTIQVIEEPSGAYVSVSNMTVSPSAPVASGSDVQVNITVSNVGIEIATNVWIEVIPENDHQWIVNESNQRVGTLQAGQHEQIIVSGRILSNIPDGSNVQAMIRVHYDTNKVTTYHFSIGVKGYRITNQQIAFSELEGNNDGVFDAGETISLSITHKNVGNMDFQHTESILYTYNPYVSITNVQSIIDSLPIGNTVTSIYTLALNSILPSGIQIPLYNIVSNGMYTYYDTLQIGLGGDVEDFESNSFATYPWSNETYPWELVTANVYEGTYAARSKQWSNNQGDNKNSQLVITWTSTIDDSISYYRKVSSEAGYDRFVFYIDDDAKEDVSGEENWKKSVFFVPAGTHTFKFSYEKDASAANGSDCAWIDYIKLPFFGKEGYTYIVDTVCRGIIYQTPKSAVNTSELPTGTYLYVDTLQSTNDIDSICITSLTVLSVPDIVISGNLEISQGRSTVLTASGADSYLWSTGERVPVIAIAPLSTTTYSVIGSNSNCGSDTTSVTVTVTLSIHETEQAQNIKLYPNPATSLLILEGFDIYRITLYNSLGKLMKTMVVSGQSKTTLNLDGYASGIYVMRVEDKNGSVSVRNFIITK